MCISKEIIKKYDYRMSGQKYPHAHFFPQKIILAWNFIDNSSATSQKVELEEIKKTQKGWFRYEIIISETWTLDHILNTWGAEDILSSSKSWFIRQKSKLDSNVNPIKKTLSQILRHLFLQNPTFLPPRKLFLHETLLTTQVLQDSIDWPNTYWRVGNPFSLFSQITAAKNSNRKLWFFPCLITIFVLSVIKALLFFIEVKKVYCHACKK